MYENLTFPSSIVVIMFAAYSYQIIHEIYLKRNIEVRVEIRVNYNLTLAT